MFVLRTTSQNFKYVTRYLQMGGRILKLYTVNIKKHIVKFVLLLCFKQQQKIVDYSVLGKEKDNTEKHKFSLLS